MGDDKDARRADAYRRSAKPDTRHIRQFIQQTITAKNREAYRLRNWWNPCQVLPYRPASS